MTYLSLAVLLIGLAIYFFANHAEGKETGRIMFFCGLLVALLHWSSRIHP